ncbi:MAG: ABC transporter permease [Chloroflexota bacterium]|nr:ABC transporter permease [Chloroflexota bacterium]
MQTAQEITAPTPKQRIFDQQSAPQTYWGDVRLRFLQQRMAVFATVVLVLISLAAIFAPLIAPFDPTLDFRSAGGLNELGQPVPPNDQFWLGTDGIGRDLLSRIIFGARVSLMVGLVASLAAVTIAIVVGGLAGLLGGTADQLLMRFVDLMMSVPTFFLMLLLVAIFSPSLTVTIVVITVFGWPSAARIFRSEVVSLKERDFVLAARCVGLTNAQIFRRHILSHLLPLFIVYASLSIPGVIFAEAGLSFLSLGIPPPTPAWGSMVQAGTQYYRAAPWVVIFPGLALMITVVCFRLLSDALRDVLDPAMRGK